MEFISLGREDDRRALAEIERNAAAIQATAQALAGYETIDGETIAAAEVVQEAAA